ncbi:hypothetical protein TRVL_10199 [Trypanosoma vivax]|nr:hypothetical protein TRVL_10199 [Trypanosoma vivax]
MMTVSISLATRLVFFRGFKKASVLSPAFQLESFQVISAARTTTGNHPTCWLSLKQNCAEKLKTRPPESETATKGGEKQVKPSVSESALPTTPQTLMEIRQLYEQLRAHWRHWKRCHTVLLHVFETHCQLYSSGMSMVVS